MHRPVPANDRCRSRHGYTRAASAQGASIVGGGAGCAVSRSKHAAGGARGGRWGGGWRGGWTHRRGVGRDCLRWDRHVGTSRPPTRRPWSRRGSPRRRCLHAPHRSALSQPRASVARGKALPPKSRSDPNRKDTIVYPTDAVLCRNPVGVCSCWGGEGVVVIVSPGAYSRSTGNRERSAEWSDMKLDMWVHIPGRGVSSERSPTAHHTGHSTHFSIKPLSPDSLPIRFDSHP